MGAHVLFAFLRKQRLALCAILTALCDFVFIFQVNSCRYDLTRSMIWYILVIEYSIYRSIGVTNAELAVLSLIAENPCHGYDIETQIATRGMREWTEILQIISTGIASKR